MGLKISTKEEIYICKGNLERIARAEYREYFTRDREKR